MKTVAKGKAAVLAHLEKIATNRIGRPGAYRIISDETGNMETVIIAGLTFTGNHQLTSSRLPADMNGLRVENGVVVDED